MAAIRAGDHEGFNSLVGYGVPVGEVGRIGEYADLYGREEMKAALFARGG
ncbi:hypothetical protein [Chromobacterium subtsugae]|nr:hypothetical protein [Chromobacterium subtsugae]